MAQAPDYFSDILGPGEELVAQLAGPGPTVERPRGPERTWYQLAVTPGRVLVVKLVQSALTGNYAPQARLAAGKEFVRIRRFPRTPVRGAHLEILGLGDLIDVCDIDDPTVFPYVEPFIAAWGGRIEGAGELVTAQKDPYDDIKAPLEGTKLLYVAVAVILILWGCCGCAGLGFVLKNYVLS